LLRWGPSSPSRHLQGWGHFRLALTAVLCKTESELDAALEIVRSALEAIRLEVNGEKTRLTSFRKGFTFLGVTFEGNRYTYLWHNKRVEGTGGRPALPIEVDGYQDWSHVTGIPL
jgi:hypothetical protein